MRHVQQMGSQLDLLAAVAEGVKTAQPFASSSSPQQVIKKRRAIESDTNVDGGRKRWRNTSGSPGKPWAADAVQTGALKTNLLHGCECWYASMLTVNRSGR